MMILPNYKICHLSDIHVRFGSRFEEYQIVFDRTLKDFKKEKPRRIILTGDLFHIKINLSPTAIEIAGEFLKKLSEIAPVDILIGNHDANLASLSQGDAISPLVKLLENGFVVEKGCKELPLPVSGNPIYFYKHSGFYNVDADLIYGIYSCLDGEVLSLTEKEPNKTYVALFHGALQGAIGDNGYKLKGDELIRLSTFNNFDAVMLGDIHQFQSFERDGKENCAYAGSLIQQNYGEEIEKGYLLWDIRSCTFERKYILNDYGYCKISIAKGELWEDRLQDSLRFSLNKKKTKIQIEVEDDEENYSVERLAQIEHWVRDRYGCEVVSAEQKTIYKDKSFTSEDDDVDINNTEESEKLLVEFLEQNNYDNFEDVIELSRSIDSKLGLKPSKTGYRIEFNKMEVCNLLMSPNEVTVFDFDALDGICGILGENYNGKSNVLKMLVWILYQKILGGGFPHRLTNMYTGSNKAWGKIYYTIGNVKYFIHRAVTVNKKKDGEYDVKYSVQYKYEKVVQNEDGTLVPKWIDVESEEKATEKSELKKMVIQALGTYEDFTKIALQGGREDYLSLDQQSKNDLVNKFLGLEPYRDKHELGNEDFKKIKAMQKVLGDPVAIQKDIDDTNVKIKEEEKSVLKLGEEKGENIKKIDKLNDEILEYTKKLHKIENLEETDKKVVDEKIKVKQEALKKEKDLLSPIEEWLKVNFKKELVDKKEAFDNLKETDKTVIEIAIGKNELSIKEEEGFIPVIESWLKENFLKEITEETKALNSVKIEEDLKKEQKNFAEEKAKWVEIDNWIKANPKKEKEPIVESEKEIENIKGKLLDLGNQLKLSKGEKCPTCNHVSHEANPELEKKCVEDIKKSEIELKKKQDFIKLQKDIEDNNNKFDKEQNKLDALKNALTAKKLIIDGLKNQIDLCAKKDEVVNHNSKVEKENKRLIAIRQNIEGYKKDIEKLKEQLLLIDRFKVFKDGAEHNEKIDLANKNIEEIKSKTEQINKNIDKLNEQITLLDKNEKLLKENKEINLKITECKDSIPDYKIMNLQLDGKLKEANGNIVVWENNIANYTEKLNQIKESDRTYKKYSVYLQAVGREGIPANIIRKKLPVINHKINTLLRGMVDFKVEMYMKSDGDVKEMFYFSESKLDSLPLNMGSQSIKFMTSVGISDSLHFVSTLIKPSIRAIDEGFDTLDNKKLMELSNLFSYLKTKYKNVFIITHKAEVKDFVEHVIEVNKTQKGMTEEQIKENPNGGTSQFTIK